MTQAKELPTMDPEQRFLQSRQARQASSTTSTTSRHETAQALANFWSELRERLQEWNERLDGCLQLQQQQQQEQRPTDEESSSLRQSMEDLKEELHRLRHHCLQHDGDSSSSFVHQVPAEFPSADWRLLHREFTNCTTKWESINEQLFPKRKFTFARYRREVARRKSLGIPLQEAVTTTATTPMTKDPTQQAEDNDGMSTDGRLQNISDCGATIQQDGTVAVSKANRSSKDSTPATKLSSSVLLLRNIQRCTFQIDKSLQALHIVNAKDTQIVVTHPIASSIHITNCQNCNFQLEYCQQLRIHGSSDLAFRPMAEFTAGGAILEESTEIVFQVWEGRECEVDVKDFNWLRSGVQSPNFRVEAVGEKTQDKAFLLDCKRESESLITDGTPSADNIPNLLPSDTLVANLEEAQSPVHNPAEAHSSDDEDEL